MSLSAIPTRRQRRPQLLKGRLIYLAEFRRDQHPLVQQDFAYLGFPTQLQTPSSLYMLYPVGRPKSVADREDAVAAAPGQHKKKAPPSGAF